jgi:hypothetical protein
MKKILLYGVNQEHAGLIRKLSGDAVCLFAGSEDLDQTLGSLFENAPAEFREADSEEEYILFSGFQTEEIGAFAAKLRKDGYPFRGIFASETEVNRVWKLKDLLEETMREHRYFRERSQVRRLLQLFEKCPREKISGETARAAAAAYVVMNQEDPGVRILRHCGMMLAEGLEKDGLL